ncbi:hypothetical protein HN51_052796 [Arachis hypogaea]
MIESPLCLSLRILKPDPYPFLNISIFLSIDRYIDIDLYLDLSPYLSKLRKNQYLKGVTNGRFSPCPRHCSPTMPRGMDKRKGPSLSFFNRSDQDKWVGFVLLSMQFSVFVRDHVGRKVVCCRGAPNRALSSVTPPITLSYPRSKKSS